mgnify:CR=1 FL=1
MKIRTGFVSNSSSSSFVIGSNEKIDGIFLKIMNLKADDLLYDFFRILDSNINSYFEEIKVGNIDKRDRVTEYYLEEDAEKFMKWSDQYKYVYEFEFGNGNDGDIRSDLLSVFWEIGENRTRRIFEKAGLNVF